MPKISIILPLYNAGKHLLPCLETLQKQVFRDFEVIIVDDASTDGSLDTALHFAAADRRFRIIQNKVNQHIGLCRNIGLQAATGIYIGFSDHDDLHHPEMYQRLHDKAVRTQADIVMSLPCTTLQGDDSNIAHFPQVTDCRQFCLHDLLSNGGHERYNSLFNTIHGNLYKRSLLVDHHLSFVDTRYITPEDKIFQLAAILAATRVEWVDSVLYIHNNHDSNAGSVSTYQSVYTRGAGLQEMYNILKINGVLCTYKEDFYLGAAKQLIRIMSETMLRHPLKIKKIRKQLRALSLCAEAMRYAPPSARHGFKRLFRKLIIVLLQ